VGGGNTFGGYTLMGYRIAHSDKQCNTYNNIYYGLNVAQFDVV